MLSMPQVLAQRMRFEREIYEYPNDQRASTLWYHDHAMGITRLNVYAGLEGLYLIHDQAENHLQVYQIVLLRHPLQ